MVSPDKRCSPARPSRKPPAARYFRPRVECLEPRAMLAVLGIDIQLLREDLTPFTSVDNEEHGQGTLQPGDVFWVQILAWDERGVSGEAPGVISLPLNIAWNPAVLQYVGENPDSNTGPNAAADPDIGLTDPRFNSLLTPEFTQQRFVKDVDLTAASPTNLNGFAATTNANVLELRGAVIPAIAGTAIGRLGPNGTAAMPSWFSRLKFEAIAAADRTPFVLQLAGSASFGDGASIDPNGIVHVVDGQRLTADDLNRITEFITIAEPVAPTISSLAGFVFLDTNPTDGQFNRVNGVPVEIGIPGVTITLTGTVTGGGNVTRSTTTNADGSYRFDNLDPGTYRVVETQPPQFIDGPIVVGTIDAVAVGVAGFNEIHSIQLPASKDGIDYSFGEFMRPDKRMFLATTDSRTLVARQAGIAAQVVRGTAGADRIVVEAAADRLNISVANSVAPQQYSIPIEQARALYVRADAADEVEFRGTAAAEVAQVAPGSSTLRLGEDYSGANYALMAVAATQLKIDARSGDDYAVIYDSPASDAVQASGDVARVDWSGNGAAEAVDFERVRAIALVRPGSNDNDTLDENAADYVLESVGDWT